MKNFAAIIFILLLGGALYALTLRGDVGNGIEHSQYTKLTGAGNLFESSHERSPFAMLLAIRKHNAVELTKELADFASPDVGLINNKFYSFFPPGIPMLVMPLYDLGSSYDLGLLGISLTIGIISLLSLVLIYLIAKQVFQMPVWASVLAAFIFGFATTSWSYSSTLYQHLPTVFLLLLAFYSAWKFKHAQKGAFIWALVVGVAYGASIFIDYPNAVLLAPVVVYFFISAFSVKESTASVSVSFKASALLAILIVAGISAGHLYYNKTVFGNPLQFHNPAPRYSPENYEVLTAEVNTTEVSGEVSHNVSAAFSIFEQSRFVQGIYRLTVATDKGLFFFSPILLFAVLGVWVLRKKFPLEIWILVSLVLVNVFMYASFHDPWGGWAFGPRYLIPSMASLALLAAAGIRYAPKLNLLTRILAFLAIAYSAAVSLAGALTTNLIPPKVEADFLKLKYNFLRNIDFLKENHSASFVYNNHAPSSLSLVDYFLYIYVFLVVVSFVLLFILPSLEKRYEAPRKS